MILPQHSDDKKMMIISMMIINMVLINMMIINMASWPHSGWPRPALVALRLHPGWSHYHLSLMILPQHRSSEYHNKSQLIIMIFPKHKIFS